MINLKNEKVRTAYEIDSLSDSILIATVHDEMNKRSVSLARCNDSSELISEVSGNLMGYEFEDNYFELDTTVLIYIQSTVNGTLVNFNLFNELRKSYTFSGVSEYAGKLQKGKYFVRVFLIREKTRENKHAFYSVRIEMI